MYGGGGSSEVDERELRSASTILADMFVAPLRKALGGIERVAIIEHASIGSRGVVKHRGTKDSRREEMQQEDLRKGEHFAMENAVNFG